MCQLVNKLSVLSCARDCMGSECPLWPSLGGEFTCQCHTSTSRAVCDLCSSWTRFQWGWQSSVGISQSVCCLCALGASWLDWPRVMMSALTVSICWMPIGGFQPYLGKCSGIFQTDKPWGQWAIIFMVLQPLCILGAKEWIKSKNLSKVKNGCWPVGDLFTIPWPHFPISTRSTHSLSCLRKWHLPWVDFRWVCCHPTPKPLPYFSDTEWCGTGISWVWLWWAHLFLGCPNFTNATVIFRGSLLPKLNKCEHTVSASKNSSFTQRKTLS